MPFLQEAELWVGVGLVLFFVLLLYLKVPTAAGKALDARGAKIKAALDEAQRLRDEAQALLASIKARHQAAEAQAAALIREAELEAERLGKEAKTKLEEQIARRTELADRRIAVAEVQAAHDVRAAAVRLAAELAEAHLSERAGKSRGDPSIDRSIAELSARMG